MDMDAAGVDVATGTDMAGEDMAGTDMTATAGMEDTAVMASMADALLMQAA